MATHDGTSTQWAGTTFGGYGRVAGTAPKVISGSVSVGKALGWRGRRIDGTGLYYLGARHYDPTAGRFISVDPFGHAASMSLYDYANGDPVNGLDPDGRFSLSEVFQTMFPAHADRPDLVRTARENGLYAVYGTTAIPGAIVRHPGVQGAMKAVGGGSEFVVGASLAVTTSPTAVGTVAGSIVALHGADTFQIGKIFGYQESAGMSIMTALQRWEAGSRALNADDYAALGGIVTSPLAKAAMMERGINIAGDPYRLTTTVWEKYAQSVRLAPTGLTPYGDVGLGLLGGGPQMGNAYWSYRVDPIGKFKK